jgi:hypothetical protein
MADEQVIPPGSSPTPAPTPASTATAPQTVTIPLEQLQVFTALQSRVAQLETEKTQREQQAREEQVKLLAAKGEAENAVKALRDAKDAEIQSERARLLQTEERAKRYALDGELARALASQPLVSAAAASQLANIFRNEFQVHAEGDSFNVRTATYETPSQFVASQLAKPDFAHFVRASSQGGTGGQTAQTAATPPATPAPEPQPKNMGEAVILHMQGMKKAEGNPQANMGLGFGLRRQG